MPTEKDKFEYRAEWSDLFGVLFVHGLLCFITVWIYYPWAYCKIKKWVLEHTYIGGRRLTFIGSGGELFGILFLQLILTIITFGIYGFLEIPTHKLLEYNTRNTAFLDAHNSEHENINQNKIHFMCKKCNSQYVVDSIHAGKPGKCKKCGSEIKVPFR
jgi:uncharacterized membrane protein YjgN (DUF898 family)